MIDANIYTVTISETATVIVSRKITVLATSEADAKAKAQQEMGRMWQRVREATGGGIVTLNDVIETIAL
jgi:hypothetical protein